MDYENVYLDAPWGKPTEHHSPVYYKIIKMFNSDTVTIACLQDFDELDCDQRRFFKDFEGRCICFYDENKAIEFLNETFKPECIEHCYRKHDNNDMFKGMLK